METLDLDKLCESTLEKIKYIWEPQSKDALKESLKFLSTSGSSDELESSKGMFYKFQNFYCHLSHSTCFECFFF